MKILTLIQGSPEWHQHRATAFNASDAPAMLGVSKYKSRSQLIKERATGIVPEVDDATQRRFNDGHRFEALALPMAEDIIGEELSPMVGAEGKYSASFDGITFDRDIIFEHKTMNAGLRESLFNGLPLGEDYRVQMEHQLMVSGAKKCLFMASTFDPDDSLVEEMHCWYVPDMELRQRIIDGWAMFEKDVAAYVPEETKEAPKAEVIQSLPSVFVQATGVVTASNLAEFKEAATTFIDAIKTELVSDEDFANAEATVKFCKEAEGNIDSVKQAITGQMSSVDEALRTLDHIKKQLADKRLMLDKLVKSEKDARKLAMCDKERMAFNDHFNALQAEITGVRLTAQHPDFGGAIKGLKSLKSMQDALDTALANGKIEADAIARDVRAKLDWCKANAEGKSALFPDLQQLIVKPMDDFQLTITSRIEKAKADEAAKLEAERQRIEAEAKAKAESEAAAKLAEETARIRAEEQAKAKAEAAEQAKQNNHQGAAGEAIAGAQSAEVLPKETAAPVAGIDLAKPGADKSVVHHIKPSRSALIKVVAFEFGVEIATAEEWLRAEFAEVEA